MDVLFFCQERAMIVDELVLALRLRWPDLRPMVLSQGSVGLKVIEREEPQVVFLCPLMEVMARVVALLRRVNLIKHQGDDVPTVGTHRAYLV